MRTETDSAFEPSSPAGPRWIQIFEATWVAWPVAWLMQRIAGLLTRPPKALRFAEIVLHSERLSIPTRHGPIRATAYFPDLAQGVPGVYVNFHGGGYVFRHPEQDDPLCRFLAHHAHVVVINVDYDVAPQRRFPIPSDEASDVAAWVAENGARHGWDGTRLALGGQSAGGALAAAAARAARDAGTPRIALQVLHYPPLDLVSDRIETNGPTYKPLLKGWMRAVFDTSYAPDRASRRDPRVSPAHPDNLGELERLAPALVISCELDVLRDEERRYAEALARAGVPTTHIVVPGVDHFYTHRLPAQPAVESLSRIAGHLRHALGRGREV